MTKWFVTVAKYCSYPNPEEHVWTISRDPNDTGWETDSGYSGYGLLKKDAEELAGAANRIEKLEAALKHYSCDCTASAQCPPCMLQDGDCGYVARAALRGEDNG